jgi:hypothetical protein
VTFTFTFNFTFTFTCWHTAYEDERWMELAQDLAFLQLLLLVLLAEISVLVSIFRSLPLTDSDDENEVFFFLWRCDPMHVMASSFLRFLYHTQRRTTVGGTPLDE